MTNLKVVIDTGYVGVDVEYEFEVDDDEVEGLSDDEINMKFDSDAWDVIQNNLCFHIERAD